MDNTCLEVMHSDALLDGIMMDYYQSVNMYSSSISEKDLCPTWVSEAMIIPQ